VAGSASAATIAHDELRDTFGDASAPTSVNPFADDDDHFDPEGGLAGVGVSAEQQYVARESYDGDDDGAAYEAGTSAGAAEATGVGADGQLGGPPPDDAPPECAAVAAWRVAFAQGLQDKADAERRGKAERAEAAREALVAMNRRWVAQCNATHDSNIIREKELLRDRDGIIARMSKPGEPPAWNVVPELVDMSGKFKEGARDTSRMRQVLLKLKTHN
jgi:Clathrin light chain